MDVYYRVLYSIYFGKLILILEFQVWNQRVLSQELDDAAVSHEDTNARIL